MVLNVLPVALSVVALTVSVIVSMRQLRASRMSDTASAIITLFAEYRKVSMRDARDRIYRFVDKRKQPVPLSDLNELREECFQVAYYFDNLGLLIGHSLLPAEPFIAFLGKGCMISWRKLYPYVRLEREKRGSPTYLMYFEMLAQLAERQSDEKINLKTYRAMMGANFPRGLGG